MRASKNLETDKYAVYNALGVGKEQAVSRRELSSRTGIRDRGVREAIEALRSDMAVLNLERGKGYYIPEPTAQGKREAAQWLARQERRVRSLKAAQRGARRFLAGCKSRQVPGQLNNFGMGDL